MKPVDCQPIYRDGRHYDRLNADVVDDIPFYGRLAGAGPILELACGTGRITIPLAQDGHAVTGVDVSASMLRHARDKARAAGVHIRWILADTRALALRARFGLILLPFNSLAHFHDAESIGACLSAARRHLAFDGRFVVDMFNPRFDYLTRQPDERHFVARYEDPDSEEPVLVTESSSYDRASQMMHNRWHFRVGDGAEEVVPLNMRVFFPQELDAIMRCAGFAIEAKYGDYGGTPFSSSAEKQLIVCRRA
ncbi:MAG: class I SAM-dependent methyltransferase [Acidobacteria bacterium]|nr:class I SAM-dependent methyltransferase [Acidobacteriota bacterium]